MQKQEQNEPPPSQRQPVKGPFTRTVTRTYIVKPVELNFQVIETVDASHDVMIPPAEGCDCGDEEADDAEPGIAGIPFATIFETLRQHAPPSSTDKPSEG